MVQNRHIERAKAGRAMPSKGNEKATRFVRITPTAMQQLEELSKANKRQFCDEVSLAIEERHANQFSGSKEPIETL